MLVNHSPRPKGETSLKYPRHGVASSSRERALVRGQTGYLWTDSSRDQTQDPASAEQRCVLGGSTPSDRSSARPAAGHGASTKSSRASSRTTHVQRIGNLGILMW